MLWKMCTSLESALSDVGTAACLCVSHTQHLLSTAPWAFCWVWHLLGVLVFTFLM